MYKYLKPVAVTALLLATTLSANAVSAERPIVELEIRNHLFWPAELVVPANTRIKLLIRNNDPTPEEFESYSLNREKVIMGNRTAVVFIGPLQPGEYPFFGEFHPKTAQGKVIAE
jgi:hypothetical protein